MDKNEAKKLKIETMEEIIGWFNQGILSLQGLDNLLIDDAKFITKSYIEGIKGCIKVIEGLKTKVENE